MLSLRREVNKFATASECLLGYEVKPADLTIEEHQVIHYYLVTIGTKFPASNSLVAPIPSGH